MLRVRAHGAEFRKLKVMATLNLRQVWTPEIRGATNTNNNAVVIVMHAVVKEIIIILRRGCEQDMSLQAGWVQGIAWMPESSDGTRSRTEAKLKAPWQPSASL